jgi:hypothetical protein
MKYVRRLSVFAFLAVIGFAALNVNADDLSSKFAEPTPAVKTFTPADATAPEGQIPLVKSGNYGKIGKHQTQVTKTNKGLLIGQIFGKYGTVYVYDNGKGYRWTELVSKSKVTVYGPGQKRRDITVELDEPAAENVKTTRWGKVYADPRLLAGWIEGE